MSWLRSLTSWIPEPYDQRSLAHPKATSQKRLLELEPAPTSIPPTTSSSSQNPSHPTSLASKPTSSRSRPHRNKIVFGAGTLFLGISILVTRRSIARRNAFNLASETLAKQYAAEAAATGQPMKEVPKINGALEAIEALNVATINVLSVAMMAVGGGLWALDINSLEEGRVKMRRAMGVEVYGKTEEEASDEIEEWIANTLARKEVKERARERAQREIGEGR